MAPVAHLVNLAEPRRSTLGAVAVRRRLHPAFPKIVDENQDFPRAGPVFPNCRKTLVFGRTGHEFSFSDNGKNPKFNAGFFVENIGLFSWRYRALFMAIQGSFHVPVAGRKAGRRAGAAGGRMLCTLYRAGGGITVSNSIWSEGRCGGL